MLTLSILWLVLAASVCVIAILRKSPGTIVEDSRPTRESGGAVTILAVLYGVALLAGFVYVSKFLVSSF